MALHSLYNAVVSMFIVIILLITGSVNAAEVSPIGSPEPLSFADKTTLIWEPGTLNGYGSFHIYRGTIERLHQGSYGDCFHSHVTTNSTTDPSVPPSGICWFYLVSGDDNGEEGTLGDDSSGIKRPNPLSCDVTGAGGFFRAGSDSNLSQFEESPGFNKDGATFLGIESINEQIDHFNGALKFNLSLFDFPQNGGMSLPITMQYNSNGIRYTDQHVNLGAGWKLFVAEFTFERIEIPHYFDGQRPTYELHIIPKSIRMPNFQEAFFLLKRDYDETDTEYYLYRTESGHRIRISKPFEDISEFTVILNDGTHLVFTRPGSRKEGEIRETLTVPVSTIVDRNGLNQIQLSSTYPAEQDLRQYAKLSTIVDTLGRCYQFSYWGPGSVNHLDSIEVFENCSSPAPFDAVRFHYSSLSPDEADFRYVTRDPDCSSPGGCKDAPFWFHYRPAGTDELGHYRDIRSLIDEVHFPQSGVLRYLYEFDHTFIDATGSHRLTFEINTKPGLGDASILADPDPGDPFTFTFTIPYNFGFVFQTQEWTFSDSTVVQGDILGDQTIQHTFSESGVFWVEFRGQEEDGTYYAARFVGTAGGVANGSSGVPSAQFHATYPPIIHNDSVKIFEESGDIDNPVIIQVHEGDTVTFSIPSALYNDTDYYYSWFVNKQLRCTNHPTFPGSCSPLNLPLTFSTSTYGGHASIMLRVSRKSDPSDCDIFFCQVETVPDVMEVHYDVNAGLGLVTFSSSVEAEETSTVYWYFGDGTDSNGEGDEAPIHGYAPGFYTIQAKFVGDMGSSMHPRHTCNVISQRIMETTAAEVDYQHIGYEYTYPDFGPSNDVQDRISTSSGPIDLDASSPQPLYENEFQYHIEGSLQGKLEEYRMTDAETAEVTIQATEWIEKELESGRHSVGVQSATRTFRDGAWTQTSFDDYDDFQQWRYRKDWGIIQIGSGITDVDLSDSIEVERTFVVHLPQNQHDPAYYLVGPERETTRALLKEYGKPYDSVVEYEYFTSPPFTEFPQLMREINQESPDLGPHRVTSWTYDAATGNISSVEDPKGIVTTYAWQWGNLSSKHITGYVYDEFQRIINPSGLVDSITDARSLTTDYLYDPVTHRLVSIIPPEGDPANADYAEDGSWIQYWTGTKLSSSSPTETIFYDSFGRRSERVQMIHDDTSPDAAIVNFWRYDLDGRIDRETLPRILPYDAEIDDVSREFVIEYRYDMHGRTIETVDHEGSSINSYGLTTDGIAFFAEQEDKANRKFTSYQDGRDHQIGFEYGQATQFSDVRWNYTRDPKQDNLREISFTPDDGISFQQSRSFTYDGFNRRISETHPETGTHSFALDLNGNVTTHWYPGGKRIISTFDDKNRPFQRYRHNGSIAYINSWDRVGKENLLDEVSSCVSSNCTSSSPWYRRSMDYDDDNRIVAEQTDIVVGKALSLHESLLFRFGTSQTFTPDGQLETITYPSGMIVEYTWDRGFLSDITATIDGTVVPIAHIAAFNPDGSPEFLELGTSTTLTRTIGPLNRLQSIAVQHDGSTESISYSYLPTGMIESMTTRWNNETSFSLRSFQYDDMDRLTRIDEDGIWYQTYSYDLNGNMIALDDDGSQSTFSIDAANRLTDRNWTVSGNLLSDELFTYTWDDFERLNSVTTSDGLIVSGFLYDERDMRLVEFGDVQPLTASTERCWHESYHIRRGDLELTRFGIEYQAYGNVGYSAGSETWEEYLYLGQQRIARVSYGKRNLWSLRSSVYESLDCDSGTLNASLTLYSRGAVPDHVLFSIPDSSESCDKTNPSSHVEVSPGIWMSTWSCAWSYQGSVPFGGGPQTVEMTAFLGSEETTTWEAFDAHCSQSEPTIAVSGNALIQDGTRPRDSMLLLDASTAIGVDTVICLISDERNGVAEKIVMRVPMDQEVGDPTSWSATVPWQLGSGRFYYRFIARDESASLVQYDESIDTLLDCRAPPVLENPQIEFYITDHLGTPRWIVDETGTIVWPAPASDPSAPYRDQPYGKAKELTAEQSLQNPYRISGKETIISTGNTATNRDPFIYFGARFYNPNTSPRFISPDPSLSASFSYSNPQSFNIYGYCHNDPMNLLDPDGELPIVAVYAYLMAVSSSPDLYSDIQMLTMNIAEGDAVSMTADIVGILIPGVQSASLKGGLKASERLWDGAKSLFSRYGDDVADASIKFLKRLGAEMHHIATNKSIRSGYSEAFQKFFDNAGITLKDAENIIPLIGHRGRHTNESKDIVLAALSEALRTMVPGSPEYASALKETLTKLGKYLVEHPESLKKAK